VTWAPSAKVLVMGLLTTRCCSLQHLAQRQHVDSLWTRRKDRIAANCDNRVAIGTGIARMKPAELATSTGWRSSNSQSPQDDGCLSAEPYRDHRTNPDYRRHRALATPRPPVAAQVTLGADSPPSARSVRSPPRGQGSCSSAELDERERHASGAPHARGEFRSGMPVRLTRPLPPVRGAGRKEAR
jgi:hypothetical protein